MYLRPYRLLFRRSNWSQQIEISIMYIKFIFRFIGLRDSSYQQRPRNNKVDTERLLRSWFELMLFNLIQRLMMRIFSQSVILISGDYFINSVRMAKPQLIWKDFSRKRRIVIARNFSILQGLIGEWFEQLRAWVIILKKWQIQIIQNFWN